jgi:hypothetical protein
MLLSPSVDTLDPKLCELTDLCHMQYAYRYVKPLRVTSNVLFTRMLKTRSRFSSGSRVSDYGLDDRANEVRSPAEARDVSSNLCIQTGSGAHPASCTMVTGVLSPGVNRSRGVTLTTHPI